MKLSIYEKTPRIAKLKKTLEKELEVEILQRGKEITIKGPAEKEYVAEKVLDAISMGFKLDIALLLKSEDFTLEILNIKDYTNKKNLERVRGRIIGKERRALDTLEQLTKCYFELKDNSVAIIGPVETISLAREAIMMIARGTKHSNVYSFLERQKHDPVLDLGLKSEEKSPSEKSET